MYFQFTSLTLMHCSKKPQGYINIVKKNNKLPEKSIDFHNIWDISLTHNIMQQNIVNWTITD